MYLQSLRLTGDYSVILDMRLDFYCGNQADWLVSGLKRIDVICK
jgi:hypothetical protein